MEAPIKTRYDKAGPQVAEALRRRHFEAHYVSTAQEALELALTLIPKDRTVSWGGIMNPASVLMWGGAEALTWKTLLTYYVTGFPVDCVHAAATVFFLWIAAEPMLEKLDRIKEKYGLLL